MSVNKVILLGNLGTAPELKYIASGTAVCNFALATSERYKGKDGKKQEKTEWHNIVAWGKTGEVLNQYLSKGKQVYIEGKIETHSWEKDEQKKYKTVINVQSFSFVGSNQNQSGSDFDNGAHYSQPAQMTEEDLPF